MITCEPSGAPTIAYRTHKFKDPRLQSRDCDFEAMRCVLRKGSPPADFCVNPGVEVVLSSEMVMNLRGERDASHKVRLDLLREAILYAMNNDPDTTEGVKGTYFVTLLGGLKLTLVLANKQDPTSEDPFVDNVFTAYHP